MCGIAGLIGFGAKSRDNIETMKARMVHRGPDADGTWVSPDNYVVFGHQRLAIMDLSDKGAQPMHSHSGHLTMVYNGEIYNWREVRDKLLREKKVDAFRSTCDSEVLLESIEAYGAVEAARLCKGMFAVAVYDDRDGTVTFLRDRVGEKPLYYGVVKGKNGKKAIAFASDLGCIASLDGFDNKINTGVLDIYFHHGYIPAPYSIYEGICKQKPGTVVTIKTPLTENPKECITTEEYWSMREVAKRGQSNLFTGSKKEAADELERLLRDSIRNQMIADVPLGAFLSAGIDSSTVVALMQAESMGKVRSFTIGMDEKGYNEATYAKEIAQHLGTEHTELYITEQDARGVVPLLPHMFSEPFADSSQIPTYLVSKMTKEHVTVSLSGDAGDELFCGYTSYASVERIWGKISKVPYALRKPVSDLIPHTPLQKKDIYRIKGKLLGAKGPEDIYRVSAETDPIAARIALDHPNLPYAYTQTGYDELHEVNHDIMLMDFNMYHPDDILVKVDRTAMAVALETRVPMLDRDVVEFAWTLPIDYLRGNGEGKLVLKDVLYRYVPKEMMDRPKKGFSIPIDKWLKSDELRGWAEDLIDRKKLEAAGILDPDVVWQIWNDFIERGYWRIQIWYILMFQAWYEEEHKKNCG